VIYPISLKVRGQPRKLFEQCSVNIPRIGNGYSDAEDSWGMTLNSGGYIINVNSVFFKINNHEYKREFDDNA
jgi:hypothetical protein